MSPIGDEHGGKNAGCSPVTAHSVRPWRRSACRSLAGGVFLRPGQDPSGDDAYAPWRRWDDPALKATPLALVAAAALAANPHDTQPWLFHVRPDAIEVYADLTRNLGAMDAYLREMHLGLGCAIENMMTAASANGFEAELKVEPGPLPTRDKGRRHCGDPAFAQERSRRSRRATRRSQNATPIATPTTRRGARPANFARSRKRPELAKG